MCLALIALGQHPLYPIIILSNRDEFYKRATTPAHFWEEESNIFSGKDLEGGGTWLGVNTNGSFSLVTNYRNPSTYDSSLLSRGILTKNYLLESSNPSPSSYIKEIALTAKNYNLFNLIVGNRKHVFYYSNAENKIKELTHGLYGISNHLLDTPWYKVVKAKTLFNEKIDELIIYKEPERISNLLFPILEDKTPAPIHLLPQTGVSMDLEESLSSIFVNIPSYGYGTRSSTLILLGENNIYFFEKTFVDTQVSSLKMNKIELTPTGIL